MARCFFRNSIGPFVLLGRVMYNKKTIQKGGSRLDKRMYLSIDLKSFYASVECLEHGLDPMTTNLVVADAGCTEKTICLAVSPSLKKLGLAGRPRLFEVVEKMAIVNVQNESDKAQISEVMQNSPMPDRNTFR